MGKIDIWAGKPILTNSQKVKMGKIPAPKTTTNTTTANYDHTQPTQSPSPKDTKIIQLNITEENIILNTHNNIEEDPEISYLYGLTKENDTTFTARLNSINSYIIKKALKGYEIEATAETLSTLKGLAAKVPSPQARMSTDSKSIEVIIPRVPVYKDMMKVLNGYPRKNGEYKVDIARAFDLTKLNDDYQGKFSKIQIDPSIISITQAPIPGFDGSINSLKNIPLTALYTITANGQTWKSLQSSRKTLSEKLESFGIENLYDLLFFLPRRYIDKSNPQSMIGLIEGETVVVTGKIIETETLMSGRGGAVFTLEDDAGATIRASFFNQKWLLSKFFQGDEVLVSGKASWFNRRIQISGASLEHADNATLLPIMPVYKQSPTKGITTYLIMSSIRELTARIGNHLQLPPYFKNANAEEYAKSFKNIHFPETLEEFREAQEIQAFYELVYMQILIQNAKTNTAYKPGISINKSTRDLQRKAINTLPFTLTNDQNNAVTTMNEALAKETPSTTLLNADVGSGKGLLENESILTPTGYKPLKTLMKGDYVTGSNGQPTKITGVYPQGEQEIASILLSDGTSIITDMEHRWALLNNDGESRVIKTGDLIKKVTDFKHLPNLTSPVIYTNNNEDPGDPEHYADELYNINENISHSQSEKITTASLEYREKLVKRYFKNINKRDINHTEVFTLIKNIARELCLTVIENNGHYTLEKTPITDRYILSATTLPTKRKTICIKVEAENELFVIRDLIITHNTVISQLSCLQAVDAGYQAVMAAPTTVLAQQLFTNTKNLITNINEKYDENIVIDFIPSGLKARDRKAKIDLVADGTTDILIGTHSVMNSVKYKNLGFIAIDEQQKFGAEQRSVLLSSRSDDKIPDLLMQTATPIPRSMSQVFYGDIDMINIAEKPPGRKPIKTEWIKNDPNTFVTELVNEVWNDIMNEAEKGNQTFIVAPLINESDKIDASSVERAYENLKQLALSSLRIAYVHGRMKPEEQQQIMKDFSDRKYDVLVSSLVVEVGVDIKNATRMVVLSADRLGASSLHQIRGRIGRNDKESICYLISEGKTENSQLRLQALVDYEDGFDIAQVDLDVRGTGKIFSSEQSGKSDMIFANINKHKDLIVKATETAQKIIASPMKDIAISDSFERFTDEEIKV